MRCWQAGQSRLWRVQVLMQREWKRSPQGSLRSVLIVLALALVSLGLLCVWAEIGRPWRSINVIFNPRTSWMSREAALAPLLLGSGVLALFGVPAALPLAALLALGFVYCQAPGGAIVRSTLGGTDTKTVGKSRSGTRPAALLSGNRPLVHVLTESLAADQAKRC